jgi:non-specific protein-tyrosine kinase
MSLITLTDPRSPQSEAYRTLRTNLSFYGLDKPLASIVVTSPAPDQGKEIAVANLAVTMAQGGKRTIVVDCDLRRPSLHSLFALSNDSGFTEMVLDETVEAPLQKTSVENLWVLSSGILPPNPADLLGTKQVERVLGKLLEQSDIVLLNTPPVISVSDAVVLGAKSDGVLLVIQAGKTRRDQAERAKQTLEQANVRIIGAALINATTDSAIGSYD